MGELPRCIPLPLGRSICQHLVTYPLVSLSLSSLDKADKSRTVAAEISSNPLREKTLAVGSWSGFGVGLAVGFVSPYIQNPEYAGLGGKIGFLWMAFSIVSGIYVFFFVPELKGRSK
jgi:hypothetical protein